MYPAVLAIALVGIVLGIGIFIMAETREAIATRKLYSDNTLNVSGFAEDVANATATNFKMLTVSDITWNNGSILTATTDYTWQSNGTITWSAGIEGSDNATGLNGTYTFIYDVTGSPEETMSTSITGVGVFADWITIIVVVLAAAIVLGVVLSSFGRKPGV